jgi:hypothetical protein
MAENPISERRLKRMIIAGALLAMALLANLAMAFLPLDRLGRAVKFHGLSVISPDDVTRIVWPVLLFPAVWIFGKSRSTGARKSRVGLSLLPIIVFHFALSVAIPFLRQKNSGVSQVALLLAYGIEPFLVTLELFLLIGILLSVLSRLPTAPMRGEMMWFRRVFISLLVVTNLGELAVEISRIAYLHTGPPPGGYWLPEPWGTILGRVLLVVYLPMPWLWIYFLVLIVRFNFKVRGAIRWCSGGESKDQNASPMLK